MEAGTSGTGGRNILELNVFSWKPVRQGPEANLDRDRAEDAGDRLEHLRDGGATVGGACHEVFLATPSNAEMALMIHVDLDVLEGACEIEDKQAVSLG